MEQAGMPAPRCPTCSGPLPEGRSHCSERCRKRALRRERKMKGLCADCGRAARGRALCPECLAGRRATVEVRRARLKEAGLCRDCGRPAAPGHARCPECLHKVSAGVRILFDTRQIKT